MSILALSVSPLSQVLAVIVGLLVMAGAILGYRKWDVEGYVAFYFATAGLALAAFGVGGYELFNALNS